MRNIIPALLLALSLLSSASAEVRPSGGVYDPRVKAVTYNVDDVVKIIGHYGFSTNIEFSKDETVQSIALGDSLAWEVAPRGNQLFVKPREDNATTNMTVITDHRSYQFWLDAAKAANKGRGEEMYFRVKFNYPLETTKLSREADEKRRAEIALRISSTAKNWNYWACGNAMLRPSEAYDDGRFTYLRYPGAQEIPAAFIINSDGAESLANGTMRGDQLVLQVVASKIILRKGETAACLENRSFNPYGVSTPNGTTSPSVERRIKDGGQPPPQLPTVPQVIDEDIDEDGSSLLGPSAMLPAAPVAPAAPAAAPAPRSATSSTPSSTPLPAASIPALTEKAYEAPVAPVKPLAVPNAAPWVAPVGSSLRDTLEVWASRSGWKIVWDASIDYPIAGRLTYNGEFLDAVKSIMKSFANAEQLLRVDVYTRQQLIHVSE